MADEPSFQPIAGDDPRDDEAFHCELDESWCSSTEIDQGSNRLGQGDSTSSSGANVEPVLRPMHSTLTALAVAIDVSMCEYVDTFIME